MPLTTEDLDHIEDRALCEGDAALPHSASYLDAVKPEIVLELVRLARVGLREEARERHLDAMLTAHQIAHQEAAETAYIMLDFEEE